MRPTIVKILFNYLPILSIYLTLRCIYPQEYANQQVKYSRKQKTHMNIALVLSDKDRWIDYLSHFYDGRQVDMGILKQEFPSEQDWFKSQKMIDLGFVGIEKHYIYHQRITYW